MRFYNSNKKYNRMEMCNNDSLIVINSYLSFLPIIFVIFGVIIVILQVITQDYYKSQLEIICLNEKIEELDLEVGLLRKGTLGEEYKSQ
jgi:hypothetical protein